MITVKSSPKGFRLCYGDNTHDKTNAIEIAKGIVEDCPQEAEEVIHRMHQQGQDPLGDECADMDFTYLCLDEKMEIAAAILLIFTEDSDAVMANMDEYGESNYF